MAMSGQFWIEGAQEAQDANLRAIAALRPSGALGKAIHFGTIAAHRYEATILHVDTGALKSSRVMEVKGLRGEVFSNADAINPRAAIPALQYAPFEFGRGGAHDAPGRTVREAGVSIAREAIAKFGAEFIRVASR